MKSLPSPFISKSAFTLVELVVSVTIIAILAAISSITYTWYMKDARDSARVSDLASLSSGLSTYLSKNGILPKPANPIEINASGSVALVYQGYASENIYSLLNASYSQDEYDSIPYTYATNGILTSFQILAFAEKPTTQKNALAYNAHTLENPLIPNTSAAVTSYAKRYPITTGNKIGILLQSGTLIPVQEAKTNIDIMNTTTSYISIIDGTTTIVGTGGVLGNQTPSSSCLKILQNSQVKLENGAYTIYPEGGSGSIVYCDMTTNGGGWTRVAVFDRQGLPYYSGIINGNIANGGSGKLADSTINKIATSQFYLTTDDGLNPLYCKKFTFDYSDQTKANNLTSCSRIYSATYDGYNGNSGHTAGYPFSHWGARDTWLRSDDNTGTRIQIDTVNVSKAILDMTNRWNNASWSGGANYVFYKTYDIYMYVR